MLLNFVQILIIAVLLLLIIVYTALFRSNGSYWGKSLLGWIVYIIAALLLTLLPVRIQPSFLFVFLHSLLILAAFMLIWGTYLFFAKNLPKIWIYSSVLLMIWMIAGPALQLLPPYYMYPGILFIALLNIVNGSIWLKAALPKRKGKLIVGWSFILLGIHHLDAPVLYLHSWITPWGYIVTFSLALLIIISMLQLYIENQQKELRASEERYRMLAENAIDLVYRYRLKPTAGYEYVSPSVIRFNGYTPEDHYADPDLIYKSVHPDDQYMFSLMGKKLSNPRKIFWLRFVRKDGQIIWTEQRYEYIYDEEGEIVAIQGIIRDITERQQMKNKIEYVSIHDSLTDLYNRSFFEAKLSQFEEYRLLPIGVILCDVDGLKLVNDSLGHDAGDQLLIRAAGFLKECSRSEDVVARIGGDEFAVLLPNSDEARTGEIADSINKAIEAYNHENPQSLLSLSVGFAIKKDTSQELAEVLKEADYNMYQIKLYRSQSIRSTIVRILTSTLHERDYITEGHSDRLQDLVTGLGRSVQLSELRIKDLRLFAHFHDIGKVGIPDRILLKPGPLNKEERQEIQRHSEIGFRIAQSGPELTSIADWILKHHEWWDGHGYPLGIAGEEIPLECRILAIADAYDAMISPRPYRDGMSADEALAELARYAGTQFDPLLTEKFIAIMKNEMLCENKLDHVS